jgi:hypothetical protein
MNSKNEASNNQQSRTGCSTELFALGAVAATPGALGLLDRKGMNSATFLDRHQRGDFGIVGCEDAQANMDAIEHGLRILSSYMVGGERLWIITEAEREGTTLLLPVEY